MNYKKSGCPYCAVITSKTFLPSYPFDLLAEPRRVSVDGVWYEVSGGTNLLHGLFDHRMLLLSEQFVQGLTQGEGVGLGGQEGPVEGVVEYPMQWSCVGDAGYPEGFTAALQRMLLDQ